MITISAIELPTSFLAPLAAAAVRTLALSGVAAAGLFVFRAKSTFARLFTWTAVLFAALAMPLLQQVLPPLPLAMPELLQTHAGQPSRDQNQMVQPVIVGSSAVDSAIPETTPYPALALATPAISKTRQPR